MVSAAWLPQWKHFFGLLLLCMELNGDISQPVEVSVSVGKTARILCNHGFSAYNALFWYKQKQDTAPNFIISGYSAPVEKGQFKMTINKGDTSTELSISEVNTEDAGVYYCAVRSTGSAAYKLLFGKGTRIVVKPNLEHSPPSIYELRPDASAVREKKDKAACLFTDYFPNPLKVKSKEGEKEVEVNGSVVVVKEEDAEKGTGSYGIVLWGDKDDNFHCAASDKNGKKFVSDTADDPGTCIAESGDNETGIRLNLLSLTVLGLRVVFLKSVAFNLLLTFRLWSRRG